MAARRNGEISEAGDLHVVTSAVQTRLGFRLHRII